MSQRSCAAFAESRSALVDGALADTDRERLLAHLVACAPCRRDVAELRELRQLLGGTARQDLPESQSLPTRLAAIGGSGSRWRGPAAFRRSRAVRAGLRRWRRVPAVLAAAGVTVVAVTGVGYAAAPAPAPPPVGDPSREARAEFAAMLGQLPLASQSLTAVVAAQDDALTAPAVAAAAVPRSAGGTALSSPRALALLDRSARASDALSYTGTAVVSAATGEQRRAARVRVTVRADQGYDVRAFDGGGRQVLAGFTPAPAPSRILDRELLSLLSANYVLSGWTGSRVAGRSATVVEAAPTSTLVGRSPSARWWVDDATGLVLRYETYSGGRSEPVLAAGFQSIRFDGEAGILEHLPPRLAVATTTASRTVSSAASLTDEGWSAPRQLDGLSLIRVRSEEGSAGVLHLVYSDGVRTMSVFQQRGRLPESLPGWRYDPALSAHIRRGPANYATWQSDQVVFTVVTDAAPEVLSAVVRDLPHRSAPTGSTMERVRTGWTRILDAVMG